MRFAALMLAPALIFCESAFSQASAQKIALASATKDAPFVNSLGMKFVPVSVGSGPSQGKTVLFSIWETRVQDYAAYASETAGVNMEWKDYKYVTGHGQEPDHPVINVSWEDAQAFCVWLTRNDRAAGWIGPNDCYRLPTDLEWNWAVGIGEKENTDGTPAEKSGKIEGVYPWGTQWPPPASAGNFSGEESAGSYRTIDGYRDEHRFTAPAGAYPANACGLFDMSGNVWEWCEDWYDNDHQDRVMRGGSWDYGIEMDLRSSFRFRRTPDYRNIISGFRCVVVSGAGG